MANLPDIEYTQDEYTNYIDSDNSLYQIPYFKRDEYFSNLDSFTKFVKACEKLVRSSDRYTAYKKYLMTIAKLDHCQVFKDVTNEDADIEMHHGPIFTLFDYCSIMIEWFLIHDYKISTFRIADAVLREHEENHVQVVMLSSTIHQEVHERNIFISTKQAFGDLKTFILKYDKAIGKDLREKYNRYIDRSMVSKSTDYGLLDLNCKLWKPE